MSQLALTFVILLQTPANPPPRPLREIPDPGTIATTQRVAPAGVQSVFTDRVFGVRFGTRPEEIWVSIHGAAYHLSWRENAVLRCYSSTCCVDGDSRCRSMSSGGVLPVYRSARQQTQCAEPEIGRPSPYI